MKPNRDYEILLIQLQNIQKYEILGWKNIGILSLKIGKRQETLKNYTSG